MMTNVACAMDLCRKSKEQQRRSLDSLAKSFHDRNQEGNEDSIVNLEMEVNQAEILKMNDWPDIPNGSQMAQSGELDDSSMMRRIMHRIDRMAILEMMNSGTKLNGGVGNEPPKRFVRKKRPSKKRERQYDGETHGNHPLLPGDGYDSVIAPWATSGGVDEDVDGIVGYPRWRGLREHDVHVNAAEDLLKGVEGEPTQFAFDEIWPVLHDGLELDVPVSRLPAGDQVEHVGAVRRLPVFAALSAGQGDAEHAEKREIGDLVAHAKQARVEVDFRSQGGNGDEGGVADN